jgi:hypothetical protein
MDRRWAVALVSLIALAGCSTIPIPPTYTQAELAQRCSRTGGWWHAERADSPISGYCEYRGG